MDCLQSCSNVETQTDVCDIRYGRCPKCQAQIEDVLFDPIYFKQEGYSLYTTAGAIVQETIQWGTQTCPYCRYEFPIEG